MTLVKCKACGKHYDYHRHGCCPHCGAYNRPPRKNWVNADGTIHHLEEREFLSGSTKGRGGRSGKVCFEQDVCYEDQARRVRRSDPEETKASPFDHARRPERKKETGDSAQRRKKVIRTVIAVIVLVNILPALLTMCSLGSAVEFLTDEVFGVAVGQEEAVQQPESLPDEMEEYTAYIGDTFLWGDENVSVESAVMDQQLGMTLLELTLWCEEPDDEPVVYYVTADGWMEKAGCDGVARIDDALYVYCYTLYEYQPDGECYVYFENNTAYDDWSVKVPLVEDAVIYADVIVVPVSKYVEVGETFLWWDEETVVVDAKVAEETEGGEISLILHSSVDFDEPMLCYWGENSEQSMSLWDDCWWQAEDEWVYVYDPYDRMADTDCWAVFTGETDGQWQEVYVRMN